MVITESDKSLELIILAIARVLKVVVMMFLSDPKDIQDQIASNKLPRMHQTKTHQMVSYKRMRRHKCID